MGETIAAIGLVVASSVSAVASYLIARLRNDNTKQHELNLERLERNHDKLLELSDDVSEVKEDVKEQGKQLKDHIAWHLTK